MPNYAQEWENMQVDMEREFAQREEAMRQAAPQIARDAFLQQATLNAIPELLRSEKVQGLADMVVEVAMEEADSVYSDALNAYSDAIAYMASRIAIAAWEQLQEHEGNHDH